MWHEFAAQQGNAPGPQQGDVVVTLLQPVGGVGEFTVPSDSVTFAAEAGNLIGIQAVLPDGRRLFAAAGNIAGVVDAPPEHESKRSGRAPRSGDAAAGTPAGAAAAHDKAEAAHDKSEAAEDKAEAEKRRPGRLRPPISSA